jgi:transglutaminase-like putative cysteine protease
MKRLRISHRTVYRYARDVKFGPHRLVFRPRDSHDLRIVDTKLVIKPTPTLHWQHDAFGNSVAIATFVDGARELQFESTLEVEHYGLDGYLALERANAWWPWSYQAHEEQDLKATSTPQHSDPEGRIAAWARGFLWPPTGGTPAKEILQGMVDSIRAMKYTPREGEGVQLPSDTLARREGTCRDFAMLMIEGLRSLGIAAHFVSGYLYDEKLDVDAPEQLGTTHAWVAVYVPGAGWLEIDPTNGHFAGDALVRVAVARDPAQVAPLSGTFEGKKEDFLGMDVVVRVRKLGA